MSGNTVLPKREGPNEAEFHDLLVAGLARVAAKVGKPTLAKAMHRTTRQLDNVMGGSTPDAIAIFDALLADSTVLDELLKAYGFKLTPHRADAANDLCTAAGLCHAGAELTSAWADGNRNHQELFKFVDAVRPHVPAVLALIDEADGLRGVPKTRSAA